MSDLPRRIDGLPPRAAKPDVSRLIKDARTASPVSAPSETAPAPRSPAPRILPSRSGRKPSLTVYVPTELQSRARAAFRQTRDAENNDTFSEMIAEAIEAEVNRREQVYNGGQPFSGGAGPLPTGRPLQG